LESKRLIRLPEVAASGDYVCIYEGLIVGYPGKFHPLANAEVPFTHLAASRTALPVSALSS
jgi:hypothetical protein